MHASMKVWTVENSVVGSTDTKLTEIETQCSCHIKQMHDLKEKRHRERVYDVRQLRRNSRYHVDRSTGLTSAKEKKNKGILSSYERRS